MILDIWVKDLKTNTSWILDEDSEKIVYKKDGQTKFKLSDIGRFRFFPCDPATIDMFKEEACHQKEMETEGYQFNFFDYEE